LKNAALIKVMVDSAPNETHENPPLNQQSLEINPSGCLGHRGYFTSSRNCYSS
jgi:hypothetical protein